MVTGTIDSPRRHGDTEENTHVLDIRRAGPRVVGFIFEFTEVAESTEKRIAVWEGSASWRVPDRAPSLRALCNLCELEAQSRPAGTVSRPVRNALLCVSVPLW